MTDINELQRFTGKGHDIILSYFGHGFEDKWRIQLKAEHEGVKLEVLGEGATPEEAFLAAAQKFDRATFSGLPEMNPSLVYDPRVEEKAEPVPEPYEAVDRDSEVPF